MWFCTDLHFRVDSLKAFAKVTLEVEGRREDGVQHMEVLTKSNLPVGCLGLLVPAEIIRHFCGNTLLRNTPSAFAGLVSMCN